MYLYTSPLHTSGCRRRKRRPLRNQRPVTTTIDHFSYTPREKKAAVEHFIEFGGVKMTPNAEYKSTSKAIRARLAAAAKELGKTTDDVLRESVIEGMSTALGDTKRKMLHETNYAKQGPYTKFFQIMRDLNKHFLDGNASALRVLTSHIQKPDSPVRVFHKPTDVIDILTLEGGGEQNLHVDAFLKSVQRLLFSQAHIILIF